MGKQEDPQTDEEAGIPDGLRATSAGQTLPSLNVAEFRQYLQQVRIGESARAAVQLRNLDSPSGGEVTPKEAVMGGMANPALPADPALRSPPPRTTVLDRSEAPLLEVLAVSRNLHKADASPGARSTGEQAAAKGKDPTGQVGQGDAVALPSSPSSSIQGAETEPSHQTHNRLIVPIARTPWSPSPELLALHGRLAGIGPSTARESFLDARVGNPFEGMMNATLEMRLPPSLRDGSGEGAPRAASDLDQVWLGPPEPAAPRLSNSFGLTDEQVASSFVALYKLENVQGESLIVVGLLGRLEYRLVNHFSQLGKAWRGLVERCRQPEARGLVGLLEPTGALSDPDVVRALQLWEEDKHDARFWTDDDGQRQKAPRLLGYQLARKRLEPLRQLKLSPDHPDPALKAVLKEIELVSQLLTERQNLLKQYFAGRAALFNAGFLTQRGLNARPGFFWTEPVAEEL